LVGAAILDADGNPMFPVFDGIDIPEVDMPDGGWVEGNGINPCDD